MVTSYSSRRPLESTGIAGLDHILFGGIARGSFFLVQGDPGSGKTTLGLQYARHRVESGQRCLYISLTETRADLEHACRSHGWSLEGIDLCDLSTYTERTFETEAGLFHPADIELGDLTKVVLDAVERHKPEHVIFDGLAEMRLLSVDALRYRKQLLALKHFFDERKITVLLLDDRSSPLGQIPPDSLVGGNLVLERVVPLYGRTRRRVFVTKVRGGNFREGYHDYEIVTGGIVVHPRLVAGDDREQQPTMVVSSGVSNLDRMLDGGLDTGTTVLLLGPAGVGKSTIGMQFVVNALKVGHKAAVYMFDEVMHTLVERSEKLCLGKVGGIASYVNEGSLHLQRVDPAEMSPGAFSHEVRRVVDAGAKVVLIDSLNGFLNSMPEEHFLPAYMHELFSFLNQKGVLTILVVAQHGMILGSGIPSAVDISYIADTVMLFRYFESRGEIHQALGVFKKRTGCHERSLRSLRIKPDGVQVGDVLSDFRGIMTGVPQYEGEDPQLYTGSVGEERLYGARAPSTSPDGPK